MYRGFEENSASAHWGKGGEGGGEPGCLTPFVASGEDRKVPGESEKCCGDLKEICKAPERLLMVGKDGPFTEVM